MLKCLIGLQLCMEDWKGLTTGLNPFTLSQHTIAVRKELEACAAKHALAVGGGAAPSLTDAKTLTAPDSATITSTLAAAPVMITRLRIVTASIFGVAHGTTSSAGDFVNDMVSRKDNLYDAMARDSHCGHTLAVHILLW